MLESTTFNYLSIIEIACHFFKHIYRVADGRVADGDTHTRIARMGHPQMRWSRMGADGDTHNVGGVDGDTHTFHPQRCRGAQTEARMGDTHRLKGIVIGNPIWLAQSG